MPILFHQISYFHKNVILVISVSKRETLDTENQTYVQRFGLKQINNDVTSLHDGSIVGRAVIMPSGRVKIYLALTARTVGLDNILLNDCRR